MSEVKFAVIAKSDEIVDANKGIAGVKEMIEDIIDDDDNVSFDKLTSEFDLGDAIKKYIDPVGDSVSGTRNYINGKLYQCIFEDLGHGVEIADSHMNRLGTQFSNGIKTKKPVIILKSKIMSDYDSLYESLNRIELVTLLEDKFIKDGIVLHPDGSHENYQYCQHHLDTVMEKYGQEYVMKNYHYDEKEVGDLILIVASDKTKTEENKRLSDVVGKPVYGDGYCSVYVKPTHTTESIFLTMNYDMLDKLLFLACCKEFDHTDGDEFVKTTEENIKQKADNYNSQQVVSPYTIIDRMYNRYKNQVTE
jgi:hypothetical protein